MGAASPARHERDCFDEIPVSWSRGVVRDRHRRPRRRHRLLRPLLGWSFEVDEDCSIGGRTDTRILAPGAPWPMGAIPQGATDNEATNLSILSSDVRGDVAQVHRVGPPSSSRPPRLQM